MINTVIKRMLLACFVSSILIVISFFILLEQQIQQPLPLKQVQLLTVDKGSSVSSFAKKLVKKGWIENRFWLRAYSRLYPNKVQIKAGTYQVPLNTNLQSLLALLASGKEHQFQLTFVEGSNFKQWLAQLAQQPNLSQTLTTLSPKQIAQRLGIEQANPEGWFFPETYAFTQGVDDFQLLKRAHGKMKKALEDLWQQRANDLPYKTPYQALIMASIIEKETSYLPEQPLIASVFINRLANKMRLQTDPTVIYGLGDRYQGDITRAHLKEKTAYNTYRVNGFPPTPIAMPGISALKAALNPATSNYFYFVSGGNGKHVFSTTLKEHNAAVRAFLAGQKNK
ncbi:MAG: endolytic transglycosylase MltG [Colwellia sp.]|nr:endolytic transglycosylase MltG [Colwellia sp.]MCW9081067.1 endolytic transglycosylase MltG [Colwellia sp.]